MLQILVFLVHSEVFIAGQLLDRFSLLVKLLFVALYTCAFCAFHCWTGFQFSWKCVFCAFCEAKNSGNGL